MFVCFFFFNDTATTEIYTLSLHDALPISGEHGRRVHRPRVLVRREADHPGRAGGPLLRQAARAADGVRRLLHRSEEHTSELQSRQYLVCRLLLEKKKKK